MTIRFPYRFARSLKVAYGLSARQLSYVGVAGLAATFLFLNPWKWGLSLLARAAASFILVLVGLAMAFGRIQGEVLERWILHAARYYSRPRDAAWQRKGTRRLELPVSALALPAAQLSVSLRVTMWQASTGSPDPSLELKRAAMIIQDTLASLQLCYQVAPGQSMLPPISSLELVGGRYGLVAIDVSSLPADLPRLRFSDARTLRALSEAVGRPVRTVRGREATYCILLRDAGKSRP